MLTSLRIFIEGNFRACIHISTLVLMKAKNMPIITRQPQLSFDKGMQYLIDRQPNTGKAHLVGFKNDE